MLLDRFFFKLFLHWLEEVRFFFCHLLVFKFFRRSRWEVFRFMQGVDRAHCDAHAQAIGLCGLILMPLLYVAGMEYLEGLQIDVPSHLASPVLAEEVDEGSEGDFCICSKLAFYLGMVLEQAKDPASEKVAKEHRPYCHQALQQLLRVMKMSYECGVEEFPVLNFNPKAH